MRAPWVALGALSLSLAAPAFPAAFGRVVSIGGHASDIALDEARGLLYVANFTANRIEVLSLGELAIRSSINVAPQPGSLALSPDGQFLLVAHWGNYAPPQTPVNALTVLNLNDNTRQSFAMGYPPLGVAFGADGRALIATTHDFLLLDPGSGATLPLGTVAEVTAKTLPVPPITFPPQIIAASLTASPDGTVIYGLTDTIRFRYRVGNRELLALGYTSSPPMGPRVVSSARDGSYYAAGWGLFDTSGRLVAQFPNPSGLLNVGSHAIDSDAGIMYAQMPEAAPQSTDGSSATPPTSTPTPQPAAPPSLLIVDARSLAVRERLALPENLAGRSILNAAADTLYSVSDSGVTILPVGSLHRSRRVTASRPDLVFRGNFCDRKTMVQELTLTDPGGGATDFSLSMDQPGIRVSPATGLTPAVVRVTVDPNAFLQHKGTVAARLEIRSAGAVNLPPAVRILVNSREPDQRGTFVNVPGKLVDILPDPRRERFYLLRQDTNEVLVFDGATYRQIAALPTSNTPTQMAFTFDRRYLLVGHDNSQYAYVYDLETLEPEYPIQFPGGHYPRSLAASGNAILAAVRSASGPHAIDRVDFAARTAHLLPSLGVYENKIHINTVLVASPNGSSILAASADGNLMLYSASANTFTVSRKDFSALAGAYAASSEDLYIVGDTLLNSSLVPVRRLDAASGSSSGFAFVDALAFRATAPAPTAAGIMQRLDYLRGDAIRPTRMAEAPLTGEPGFAFTRTVAPLYNRSALVVLTTSGFTVLPWTYDAAVARPRITRVVNAADRTEPVAPGGLVTVLGENFSPTNLATREVPLPTALGESCLTVNGLALPMLFVSPREINGQLPFQVDGKATMVLRTPGGVSDNFYFSILPAAPRVFQVADVPTVVRAKNGEPVTPTNPIHPDDDIVIYATGLGLTDPAVETGYPAPSDPLPRAILEPLVTLGGEPLSVFYAGLAPGEVGVYQINARVPGRVPLGMSVPLTISQPGGSATTLDVRVVK